MSKPEITTAENVTKWAGYGSPAWWAFVCRVSTLSVDRSTGSEVRTFRDGSALVVRSAWYDDAGRLVGLTCAPVVAS